MITVGSANDPTTASATPEPYPFVDTLARLEILEPWLKGLGHEAPDRIRRYTQNIREMIELQAHDVVEGLKKMTPEKRREILWSYVEADEFVRAVEPLRASLGDEMARSPVGRAIEGPADLFLEKQGNNQARNFMFELVMGGRLAKAGFRPAFDQGPDIAFEFKGMRVAIQCKRPLSMSWMESNISKAISQLKSDRADLSLIAISVSRLLNSGNPDDVPEVARHEDGQTYLDVRGREIADSTRRFWKGKLDRAGILFYGFTPIRWPKHDGHYGQKMLRVETMCPLTDDEDTRTLLRQFVRDLKA